MLLYKILILITVFCQAFCQQSTDQHATSTQDGNMPTGQQGLPQLRQCRCDELEQCYNEQSTQQKDLTSRCSRECGTAFLPNNTIDAVDQCYQAYQQSKYDHKANKYRCVENLISKQCLSDQQQSTPTQATLTIDPTILAQPRTKHHYKPLFPSQLNSYYACVKTCRKNGGVVHFNADGTPEKTAGKTGCPHASGGVVANMGQKPGKGNAACAAKLGCQLIPIDKKLEKQAKQICKYQNMQKEDDNLNLCTCLEKALNQNLQCTQAPVSETCSSSSGQSGQKSGCDGSGPK